MLQTFGSPSCNACFKRLAHHALISHKKKTDCKHNEKVKENRNILKRLINVVAFLRKQECAFRAHDEWVEYRKKGMYKELLELLAKYNLITDNYLKIANIHKETSPAIQNWCNSYQNNRKKGIRNIRFFICSFSWWDD